MRAIDSTQLWLHQGRAVSRNTSRGFRGSACANHGGVYAHGAHVGRTNTGTHGHHVKRSFDTQQPETELHLVSIEPTEYMLRARHTGSRVPADFDMFTQVSLQELIQLARNSWNGKVQDLFAHLHKLLDVLRPMVLKRLPKRWLELRDTSPGVRRTWRAR